ncbi:ABC transporter ATP-binding protein [Helcococcus ovis]|uniref:ABC transporter ATP-binding protein n=1 Tax=Helcococcus ovis TaxID=72026 RepID=A0A4R9BZV6_9FIRM|nr:ABC transporter ATP-binding protein [Helcococcus ovis]TFF64562.1 ABC transporter ATP-binding protein [Helcococcus ovis]TFF64642.1 ABC transporter ATP-binding protein [Helcococcus ovis]TFF68428.1 ABC transporter ATP-binding protein [Helcococcus ovis]WNZ00484.1 ABC transporter ATP-binding protein [Helcococcus ovis]
MISVKNLRKDFGNKLAVNNISFEVKDGEILGFLGPNGAGKTTTISMIVGLLEPTSGEIEVNGIDAIKNSFEAKKQIAFLPDNPEIYENMSGRKFVTFVANIYGVDKNNRDGKIEELAKKFGLQDDIDALISTYSHGMKQKIALISALVHDPEVLILDEPMVGLDPQSAFNLKELMRERCDRGKSVFFSSHVMEVVEKICDRIIIIKHGNIIAQGTIEQLKQHSNYEGDLEKLFLELTND